MADGFGWLHDRLPGVRGRSDEGQADTPIDGLTVGQVCDLLANDRRRRTLIAVDEGTREIRVLSEEIVAIEAGMDYTEQERQSVHVSLIQTHLPLLVEYGVLEEVDHRGHAHASDRAVVPGPRFDGVYEALIDLEYRVALGRREAPDG